jgi:D-sedoheptulose 7-phosphate isomerase
MYYMSELKKDYISAIKEYLALEISVLQRLDAAELNAFMNELEAARQRGAMIYIMGNGGSAATASHYVNDFNKGLSEYLTPKFRFACLSDNTATVMAVANDIGYEEVFAFQLRGVVTENDLVVGLSGSGNSPNVLRAIEVAKAAGAKTVGLTGLDGGALRRAVDISVHVPVPSMQVTEDVHLIFDHLIMAVFYKELCGINHLKGGC